MQYVVWILFVVSVFGILWLVETATDIWGHTGRSIAMIVGVAGMIGAVWLGTAIIGDVGLAVGPTIWNFSLVGISQLLHRRFLLNRSSHTSTDHLD